MQAGFCDIRPHDVAGFIYTYRVIEPLSIRHLWELYGCQEMYESVREKLQRMLCYNPRHPRRGKLLKRLVALHILTTWSKRTFADLPFLAPYKAQLPEWCHKATCTWTMFATSGDTSSEPHGPSTNDILTSNTFITRPYHSSYVGCI